jgi:hypothetical protein
MLVTILIGIIIILGIVWLNKNYINKKEGLADIQEVGSNIMNYATSQMATLSGDNQASIDNAINQMNSILSKEVDSISDAPYAEVSDSSGVVIDTTPEVCTDPNSANCTSSALFVGQNKSFFSGTTFSKGFCQTYGNNPMKLNQQCNRLTAENCNATDCCVFLNGAKCVAGSQDGPLFTVEDGQDVDYAYYSYKNTCYGSCGKGQASSANPCTAYNDTDANLSVECLNRLWKKTGCPNNTYINAQVIDQLKDYSKVAIKKQFKDATLEQNYPKCYGTDMTNWPVPCVETTPSSFGLGPRCMTKLLTDSGCTNTSLINQTFVDANRLEPKSALINQFNMIKAGKDIDSYRKCYGNDILEWPDACAGVPDTARFSKGEVPQSCSNTMWRDVTQSKCTNTGLVDNVLHGPVASTLPDLFTLGFVRKTWKSMEDLNDVLSNIRTYCKGINPNNWPDVTPVLPDPCEGIDFTTQLKDTPMACRQRLASLFPATNLTHTQKHYKSILNDASAAGAAPLYQYSSQIDGQ